MSASVNVNDECCGVMGHTSQRATEWNKYCCTESAIQQGEEDLLCILTGDDNHRAVTGSCQAVCNDNVCGRLTLCSATTNRYIGQTLHCQQPNLFGCRSLHLEHTPRKHRQPIYSVVVSASPEVLSVPALIPGYCTVVPAIIPASHC